MLIFSMPIFNKNQNRWDQLLSFCVETRVMRDGNPSMLYPLETVSIESNLTVLYISIVMCVCVEQWNWLV